MMMVILYCRTPRRKNEGKYLGMDRVYIEYLSVSRFLSSL